MAVASISGIKLVRRCIRPGRVLAGCLLGLVAAASAEEGLEQRVEAIEQANVTAHWEVSAGLIRALGQERQRLDPELAFRIDLVEARNAGLAGDSDVALEQLKTMLEREVPPKLRIRALTLAVNLAANRSDFATAFVWLRDGLNLLEDSDEAQPRLLAMASYLYLRVGEEQTALNYARQSLAAARANGSLRDECVALSDYAMALILIGHAAQSETTRREQVEVCGRAGDPVFVADGHQGIGMALLSQGRPELALPWIEGALERFERSGFGLGTLESKVFLAEALLRLERDLPRATALLTEVAPQFDAQELWHNIERSRRLLSEVFERKGQPAEALAQLRLAQVAGERIERDARQRRLSFLQAEFDSKVKERRIAELDSERQRQASELTSRQQAEWLQALLLICLLLVSALLLSMLWRSLGERRRYRELSERDGLTGLLNHQSTLRQGQRLFERSRQQLMPFTAVVADIDRFKQINDRFGHAAGDAVLRSLGDLLRQVFPGHAVVGRSGGEEFSFLIAASLEQTRFLIEELRRRIMPLSVFNQRIDYSLSFGLCQAGERHHALEDVLRAADLALYQAKQGGRNRVVDASTLPEQGRPEPGLVVVGTGIQLGRHLSERCLSEIREAERVFALTDPAAWSMLQELRPDIVDLRCYYAPGKDRRLTYREMDEAIMAEVSAGRRVCAVFYGHPGVFADVPHAVIRKAREAGFRARMEPGISSEACLYADLGLDPGRHGVQSIEATQFLAEDRRIDSRSLLLLWQVALTGDLACTRFHAEPEELHKLVERLLLDYPPDHEVILYEAARLPVEPFRAEHLALRELPHARFEEYTTLVIPPRAGTPTGVTERLFAALRETPRGRAAHDEAEARSAAPPR